MYAFSMSFNKNELNKMSSQYIKIPFSIVRRGLPAQSVAIYVYMASHEESFHPSLEMMGEQLQLTRQTTKKYLKILLDQGIISLVVRANKFESAKYRFNFFSQWKIVNKNKKIEQVDKKVQE